MKLYLAGPMTGIVDYNFPLFHSETARLREVGFEVVNPAELNVVGTPWVDCLKKDLRELLTCDGVALLPNWQKSKGASLEHDVARRLDMPVRTVNEWIQEKP